jgi:shikimate dehydrogenase
MNEALRSQLTLTDLRAWPATIRDLPAEAVPRLAVLGHPVAHSLSPAMHDAALLAAGLPGRYAFLHVHPEELAEVLRLLPGIGFIGANVTLPHKTAALALLPAVDPAARRLGAINTLRVEPGDPGGKQAILRGFNTDGPGLLLALRDALNLDSLRGKGVLVLGAGGGAGHAFAVQCALAGCARLRLANRTEEKARCLAEELRRGFPSAEASSIEAVAMPAAPWHAAPLEGIDLVIHATPLGLRDDDPPAIPALRLRDFPGLAVYDTVYRRHCRETPLVRAAREAGLRAADGLSLLLWQGALAFEIWFSRPAPVSAMRAALGDCCGSRR